MMQREQAGETIATLPGAPLSEAIRHHPDCRATIRVGACNHMQLRVGPTGERQVPGKGNYILALKAPQPAVRAVHRHPLASLSRTS